MGFMDIAHIQNKIDGWIKIKMETVMEKKETKTEQEIKDEKNSEQISYLSALLKEKLAGKITQKEFENKIAETQIKNGCHEHMKYVPLPDPPDILVQYWNLPRNKKDNVKKAFFNQAELVHFRIVDQKVKQNNAEDKRRITNLLTMIAESDTINIKRTQECLQAFKVAEKADLEKRRKYIYETGS